MNKKNIQFISFMKTGLMVGVVLLHACFFYSDYLNWSETPDITNDICTALCKFINACLVPGFVFASGYLINIKLQDSRLSSRSILKSRARRLLLTYYVYGTLWLVPLYTLFDISSWGRPMGTDFWGGLWANVTGQFSDVTWFLWMLFDVSVIWILLRKLLSREKIWLGAVCAAGLAVGLHYALLNIPYFKLSQIAPYILCFFAGAAAFQFTGQLLKLPAVLDFGIGFCLMALAIPITNASLENFAWNCVIRVLTSSMCLFLTLGLQKIGVVEKMMKTKGYRFLEKNSMNIYLFQFPFMFLVQPVCHSLFGKWIAVTIILLTLITILQGWLVGIVKDFLWKKFRDILLKNHANE